MVESKEKRFSGFRVLHLPLQLATPTSLLNLSTDHLPPLFLRPHSRRPMARQYTLHRPPPAPHASGIDYVAALNAEQYAAVSSPPGRALVIAGAGSGKTRTLTYRVAWLLDHGIDARADPAAHLHQQGRPRNDRARPRTRRRTTPPPSGPAPSTRSAAASCAATPRTSASPARSPSSTATTRNPCSTPSSPTATSTPNNAASPRPTCSPRCSASSKTPAPPSRKSSPPATTISTTGPKKSSTSAPATSRKSWPPTRWISTTCWCLTVRLFEEQPDVLDLYQKRFKHILVDEYQDTNSRPGPHDRPARRRNQQPDGGRRRRAVDLLLARRGHVAHPRFPAALSRLQGLHTSRPTTAACPRSSISPTPRSAPTPAASKKTCARPARPLGAKPALVALPDPAHPGGLCRPAHAGTARRGHPARGNGRALPRALPEPGNPDGAHRPRHSVRASPAGCASSSRPTSRTSPPSCASSSTAGTRSASSAWSSCCPAAAPVAAAQTLERVAENRLGRKRRTPAQGKWSDLFLKFKVPKKSAKHWEQLCYTLDELTPDGEFASAVRHDLQHPRRRLQRLPQRLLRQRRKPPRRHRTTLPIRRQLFATSSNSSPSSPS